MVYVQIQKSPCEFQGNQNALETTAEGTNLKQKVNIGRRRSGLVDNMDDSLDFTAT